MHQTGMTNFNFSNVWPNWSSSFLQKHRCDFGCIKTYIIWISSVIKWYRSLPMTACLRYLPLCQSLCHPINLISSDFIFASQTIDKYWRVSSLIWTPTASLTSSLSWLGFPTAYYLPKCQPILNPFNFNLPLWNCTMLSNIVRTQTLRECIQIIIDIFSVQESEGLIVWLKTYGKCHGLDILLDLFWFETTLVG